MATKNMMYDHPAYTAVYEKPVSQLTGSGGASTKFAAFTAQLVKSVTIAASVVSTSADVINVIKVATGSGTNTTTTTTAYGTLTTGQWFGNFTPALASNQVTLNQGDTYWITKGTDLTGTYVGSVELVTIPLANVTL